LHAASFDFDIKLKKHYCITNTAIFIILISYKNKLYFRHMTVSVIGLGTMGLGIVQVAAQNNCTVLAFDANTVMANNALPTLKITLEKLVAKQKITAPEATAILNNITVVQSLQELHASDVIIEAIIENLEIKKKIFAQLDTLVSDECILATNTSSLSVTSIAAACAKPERVIGIHFFNPAPIMQLVEIIPALQTSQSILTQTISIVNGWKKIGVIAKDTPGFIVNRIARPYYSEAIRILEESIATKEMIDAIMENEGFKMGPFALMDMIGHDVNYVVTETVWQSMFYDPRYKPSFTQKRLLEAGWLGKKSGKGFYNYEVNAVKNEPVLIPEISLKIKNRIIAMLINEAADALYLNIATKQDIETAMTKGVNYPKGLLQWANEIGIAVIVNILDELYSTYHEDRYRCSIMLRNMLKVNGTF
jgi:3-hydroxybutyryl-CoA dehydrogenase